MKRLFTTISAILFAISASGQNFSCWEHYGNDEKLHQCYDIIEMSDGNFLVDDDIFIDNEDFGIMLYKITPDAVAIDSAFIPAETLKINGGYIKIRDPFNDDRNILTSFYNRDNQGYYKALFVNDNLEIVDEIEAELGIEGKIGSYFKAFVNQDNDIVIHDCINDTTERFYIVGIDGETKFVSQPVERKFKYVAQRPFFIMSLNPLRYGFITLAHHSQYGDLTCIEEYDADFNRQSTHNLRRINQNIYLSYYANAFGSYLDDDSFIVTVPAWTSYPNGEDFNIAIKYDHDFQPVATHIFGDSRYDYLAKRNIAVSNDGRIYIVWSDNVGTKSNLMVDCLDFDLNLKEQACCLGYPHVANYGITCRENGGLALSGWTYDSEPQFYESKRIYAVIFNEFMSATETSADKVYTCYPNPCSTSVSLEISPDVKDNVNAVSVYDIAGRTVKTQTAGFESVDISGLAPGIYVMKVTLADGRAFEEKIVKE